MSTSLTSTPRGVNGFTLMATSTLDSPTFYWYENGVLVATTTLPIRDIDVSIGETMQVDVFDDIGDTPSLSFSGRALFTWEPDPEANTYLIERWDGDSDWEFEARIPEDGNPNPEYTTDFLDDDTTYLYRVTPEGVNAGTARELSILIVRIPSAPEGTYAYDSGTGDLVFGG